jgi:hopanoid biosynthesis associated radical SAM protein HpnH
LDGQREHHDMSVCKEGGYDIAVDAIKAAVKSGFRVTTNATFFDGTDPSSVRGFFDEVMAMGVEGIVLSPGYSYEKAPDQNHFMGRARARRLFRAILSNRKPTWKFNMSPLFLEFLMGDRSYECTPWGSPAFNIFGWQRPCYLLQDGYAASFKELLETTRWENYGAASGNPKCANCMVSCGYEPTAVMDGFTTLKGFWGMVQGTFRNYPDRQAVAPMRETAAQEPAAVALIESSAGRLEETHS